MKRIPFFLLIILLPSVVLIQSFKSIDWHFPIGYLAVVSLITVTLYWYDKRQSQNDARRIPEKILHLLELIGGWPAAYLAQQYFHHKTLKRSYRITYWLIVATYQYLALESLIEWRILKSIIDK